MKKVICNYCNDEIKKESDLVVASSNIWDTCVYHNKCYKDLLANNESRLGKQLNTTKSLCKELAMSIVFIIIAYLTYNSYIIYAYVNMFLAISLILHRINIYFKYKLKYNK